MNTDNKHTDPVTLLPKVFAGEATPEEHKLVEEWLLTDSANRTEYDSFAKLWNITSTASALEDIDIDSEWQKMEMAITPVHKKMISMLRIFQIAASFIFISVLAFFGVNITRTKSEKAPVTASSMIFLPDSTSIVLNAGSKIIYKKDFGISHRSVSLKGEAYFDVAGNSSLPFIINVQKACIRVTGTKFNVKAYAIKPEIRVMVLEGTVDFYEATQPLKEAKLSAGETGIYNKTSKEMKKVSTNNLNDLSWKTRVIDFHNTPLADVVEILTDTYHQSIVVDPAIEQCSVTVRFENQELDSVFDVLKSTLDLSITRKGRHIIITGKGC